MKKALAARLVNSVRAAAYALIDLRIIRSSFHISLAGYSFSINPELRRSSLGRQIAKSFDFKGCKLVTEKSFYQSIDSPKVFFDDSATQKSLVSYLPYLNNTGVVVFANHFFAANYGQRAPLVVQVSVVSDGGSVVWCDSVILSAYSQALIDVPALLATDASKHCFVYIQCFGPSIKHGHGGHDGYYRVHGFFPKRLGDEFGYSVVHSMPYKEFGYCFSVHNNKFKQSRRGFLPSTHLESCSLSLHDPTSADSKSDSIKSFDCHRPSYALNRKEGIGFIACLDSSDKHCTGVWHDGPSIQCRSKQSEVSGHNLFTRSTSVYVPNMGKNAPYLLFDPRSLGFSETVTVDISLVSKNLTIEHSFVYTGSPVLLDTLGLGDGLSCIGSASIYIRFVGIPPHFFSPLMVHVLARDSSGLIGDCSHTLSGFTKNRPSGYLGGMLTWAPFFCLQGERLRWTYCLHNVFNGDHDPSGHIKIKIFTDQGYEFSVNIPSLKSNMDHVFTCDDLHRLTGFKEFVTQTASVQFESRLSRIGGTFYISSSNFELLGFDHLTGG